MPYFLSDWTIKCLISEKLLFRFFKFFFFRFFGQNGLNFGDTFEPSYPQAKNIVTIFGGNDYIDNEKFWIVKGNRLE